MTLAPTLLDQAIDAIASTHATTDPDYPLYHLAPPVGRLNDPNGLIVRDGVHHAFYQFGPFFPHRKAIYWGHASSTDLVTWRQHEPAIAPDSRYDRSGAYSGGAVVQGDTVWLHYTGNVKDGERRESSQCAVTTDDLASFAKHPANPLIPGPPPGYTTHLRDPQVLATDDGYLMLLGGQRDDLTGCVLCYRSSDLLQWRFVGELTFPDSGGRYDSFGYMWECPNLLRVPDEVSGEVHDVLLWCPQGMPAQADRFRNIFPCGYLVGRLDGTAFHSTAEFRELDAGFEFYAPQTFVGGAGPSAGGPLLLGWLGNAAEDDQPSLTDFGWVHTMTVARELTLRDGVLRQRPVIDALGGPGEHVRLAVAARTILGATSLPELSGSTSFALDLVIERPDRGPATLTIGTPETQVDIEVTPTELIVDRSQTRYPNGGRRSTPLPPPRADGRLRLQVLHDRSTTEVFVDDGALSFSLRSYLSASRRSVRLHSEHPLQVHSARIVRLD